MKKLILASTIMVAIISCKNEDKKPVVVGTSESGEELVVNETGDTVVYTPTDKEEVIKEDEKEDIAFQKNESDLYDFNFNLKKGETYPFKIVTTAKSTQSDGNQSMTVSQESTTEIAYHVRDITAQGFILDVEYKRFAESMSDGKKSLAFDTQATEPTDEAAKQRWEFNKAIVGNSFKMVVDKKGKVQDVSNLYKIREKVKSTLKSDLKEEQLSQLDQFLKAALSEEAMIGMFEESIAYYPKKAVKKGDTWTRTESEGNAKSTVTYTFDGIEENVATIKINGTSNGSDSQTDPNGSGMKIFRSLDGKVNGTVKLDAKSGWIKTATMDKTETIKMTQQLKDQKANFSSEIQSTTKIN